MLVSWMPLAPESAVAPEALTANVPAAKLTRKVPVPEKLAKPDDAKESPAKMPSMSTAYVALPVMGTAATGVFRP